MDFLKRDLQHLFDDQGIDKSQYDDVVEFRDPITQYNNASGESYQSLSGKVIAAVRSLHSPMTMLRPKSDNGRDGAGYMFNISMLKRVFNPTFELHDIKQTGEYEATTRW